MTNEQFIERHKAFFNEATELAIIKNKDYSGGADSPFANFTMSTNFGIKPEVGFLVRIIDKVQRISNIINSGEVFTTKETVRDTLIDLANYSNLLASYFDKKENIIGIGGKGAEVKKDV